MLVGKEVTFVNPGYVWGKILSTEKQNPTSSNRELSYDVLLRDYRENCLVAVSILGTVDSSNQIHWRTNLGEDLLLCSI